MSTQRTILHLYKDFDPVLGGIENHIRDLSLQQTANGNQVTVIVTNPGKLPSEADYQGIHLLRVPQLATIASTPLTFDFLRQIPRHSADITHLHFPYPIAEISQFLAGKNRPYVITYHSDVVRASQQTILKLYQPILKKVLDRAGRILVTSPGYAASSPLLSTRLDQCSVVPLGINPQPFLKAKAEYTRPRNQPILLFMGRHRYYKGLDVLLHAMTQIDALLWVGGSGPMRTEWQALALSLGVAHKVRFFGDISPAQLPGLYASADIFVLPSILRAEAFGLVLLEAMASGLPCITTELGTGTSYVVQNGETGLVVPPGSPQAIAEAIQTLLNSPEKQRRMGNAGRERMLAEFTLSRMAARVDEVYAKILS